MTDGAPAAEPYVPPAEQPPAPSEFPTTVAADGAGANPPAADPDVTVSKKEKPAKKATKAKPNKRAIKAALDAIKAQIADHQKQTTLLNQQVQDLLTGDTDADKEMNGYHLEHNELIREYQVSRQEVKDLETIVSNKSREIEETHEISATELHLYKRRVKHLMAANQTQFAGQYFRNEQEAFLERQQQQLEAVDRERIANALRSDSNNLQLENETLMTNHRMKQDRVFTELREEFEREVYARRDAHEQRVHAMRKQLEDQHIREKDELQQQKDDHIRRLQAGNARAFDRIQHYFSGITHNNLDVIKQNKAKIAKRKMEMNAIRKTVDELNSKRRKLEEPLNALIAENERMLKEIDVYKQDKRDLARNKAAIRVLEDEMRDLQLAQEVLEQRFQQLERERDSLFDQFETSIHDMRQKTEFHAYVLEQKVNRLREEMEKKDLQLQDMMQHAGVDSTAISAKIEDVIAVKTAKINELETALAKIQRAHNDILAVYEEKMRKFGIPKDEMGFQTITSPVVFSAAEPQTE
jgi:hypothetical protein